MSLRRQNRGVSLGSRCRRRAGWAGICEQGATCPPSGAPPVILLLACAGRGAPHGAAGRQGWRRAGKPGGQHRGALAMRWAGPEQPVGMRIPGPSLPSLAMPITPHTMHLSTNCSFCQTVGKAAHSQGASNQICKAARRHAWSRPMTAPHPPPPSPPLPPQHATPNRHPPFSPLPPNPGPAGRAGRAAGGGAGQEQREPCPAAARAVRQAGCQWRRACLPRWGSREPGGSREAEPGSRWGAARA